MSPLILLALAGGGFWWWFLRDGNGMCVISSQNLDVQNLLNAAWASSQRADNYNYQLSLQAVGTMLDPNAGPSEHSQMAHYQEAIFDRLSTCDTLQEVANLVDMGADYEAGQVIRVAMTRGV